MRGFTLLLMGALLAWAAGSAVPARTASAQETLEGFKELVGFADWPGKAGLVRPLAQPSPDNVPLLAGTTELWLDKQPVMWEMQEGYVARYHLRCEAGRPDDCADFVVAVAQSCEDAHEYVVERYFNSTLPFEAQVLAATPDEAAVSGELSFRGGSRFIRSNIAVEIWIEGEMADRIQVAELAKQVDSLLLGQPTGSAAGFRPVIQRFELTGFPGGSRELVIEATDPLGGELFYDWHPPTHTGIEEDDSGRYYLYCHGFEGGTLTLNVITESGFFSTAKIEISVDGEAPVEPGSWGEIKKTH